MNAQTSQNHRQKFARPFIRAVRASDAVTPCVHGAVSQHKQGVAVSGQPVQRQQQRRPVRCLEDRQALRLDIERQPSAWRSGSRASRLRHQDPARWPQSLQPVCTVVVSHRRMRRKVGRCRNEDSTEYLAANQFERTTGGSMCTTGGSIRWQNASQRHSLNHDRFSQGDFAVSIEPQVSTFIDIPRAGVLLRVFIRCLHASKFLLKARAANFNHELVTSSIEHRATDDAPPARHRHKLA